MGIGGNAMLHHSIYDPTVYTESYWPHISYQYARTWRDYAMGYHKHTSTEIMYLFVGSCSIFVRDHNRAEQEIKMHSGEFIVLDSNILHRLHVGREESCYMLNIEFFFEPTDNRMHTMKNIFENSEYVASVIDMKQMILRGRDDDGELYSSFSAMLDSFLRTGKAPINRCLFDAEFTVFIMQLARCVCEERARLRKSIHVRRALQYIHSNYYKRISVPMIASHAGVHAAYLQRIFRESVGSTMVDFITRLRIDKAKALLEHMGALSVEEIAIQVGFANRQRFTACFKGLEGLSPCEYRNSKKRAERRQYTLDTALSVLYDSEN